MCLHQLIEDSCQTHTFAYLPSAPLHNDDRFVDLVSMTVRFLMIRPSAVRSNTKSIDQTWLVANELASWLRSASGPFLRFSLRLYSSTSV